MTRHGLEDWWFIGDPAPLARDNILVHFCSCHNLTITGNPPYFLQISKFSFFFLKKPNVLKFLTNFSQNFVRNVDSLPNF